MYAMQAQREWAQNWCEAISVVTYKMKTVHREGAAAELKEPRFSARLLPARYRNRKTGEIRETTLALENAHMHLLSAMMRYASMDDLEGDHCFCRASNYTLAEQTRMSVSLVEKTVADLAAVGLIQRTQQHGTSSVTKLFRTAGNWNECRDEGKAVPPGLERRGQRGTLMGGGEVG